MPVTWDVSLNLAKNKNKVIQLSQGVTEINVEEPRTRTVYIKHIVGYPFGMITGYSAKNRSLRATKYMNPTVPLSDQMSMKFSEMVLPNLQVV